MESCELLFANGNYGYIKKQNNSLLENKFSSIPYPKVIFRKY